MTSAKSDQQTSVLDRLSAISRLKITVRAGWGMQLLEECIGRLPRHRGRDIKSGLVVFFTIVKLTDLNERTALGFAVQVAVT